MTHPQQQTTTPPRCRYDRGLGERVTRDHADDCPDPQDCRGCAPCLHGHCAVCSREHLDDAHPNTCPTCVAGIRDDLTEIRTLCTGLREQASQGEGYAWAMAPIPGADAMVSLGPAVPLELVRVSRHFTEDHRRGDLIPPLAVLAHWEDTWRTWLGHEHRRRAGITAAVRYLDEHLTAITQARPRFEVNGQISSPPEVPEFSRAIARLRAQLEHTLHDEQEPDRGVECFECGHRLVRRHRDRRRCHHQTPAREWFATLLTYPELRPRPTEVAAARAACTKCDQGGLADPTPGVSWECPACRKAYTPGEYATAVRRDLLESEDASGWSTFPVAASAAADITGRPITVATIRKWIERGDEIATVCVWEPGRRLGNQLVFWPDVAVRATEVRRAGRRRVA